MVAERAPMSSLIPWFEVPSVTVAGVAIDLPSVLAVAGVLVTLAVVRRGALRAGLSPRRAVDALALVMLSALMVGRLAEVIYYPERLTAGWQVLLPWRGGYTSLGVFFGTAAALALLSRACQPAFRWRYLDVMVPAALLGGAIVRVGCFLGHHHAGRLTTMPGAVAYPGGPRYDLGLCEALLLFAIAGVMGVFGSHSRARPGWNAVVGATSYAAGRFAIECLRGADLEAIGRRSDGRYLGLTLVQYATAVVAAVGMVWLWRRRRQTQSAYDGPA